MRKLACGVVLSAAVALGATSSWATTIDPSNYDFNMTISPAVGKVTSTISENFPLLVRLSAARQLGFDPAKCGVNGEDLRFALADGTLLAHEIDTWKPTGESLVWVNVPSLAADTQVIAYWGVKEDLAYAVNGEGVKNLALACREVDCPLVHVSTDYVFDGTARDPIEEDGEIGPISIYGKSKLKGEEAILEILDKYFIVRTAWLYGINGKNFPKTMLELAKDHPEITVVYDEVGTPTYTPDLAYGISQLIETDFYGIYHLTNSGSCSWCEFAKYIFEIAGLDINVIPVTASEFSRPAPRPSYSVLKNKKWTENGFEPLRDYKEAIKEYLELIK